MRFFFRTVQVFVLKILVALLGFYIQVQLGRLLGMDGYGSFSLFLSLASVVSIFPLLGMDSGLIREVAAADSFGKRKWCVLISLSCSLLILLMLGLIMPLIFPRLASSLSLPVDMLSLLILYLAVLVLNTLAGAVLQGEQRNVLNDGTIALTSFCKVIVIYILSQYGVGLYEVLLSYIVLELICTLGRWGNILYRYKDIDIAWQSLLIAKNYIGYCLPLFFVSSIGVVQCSLHRFVTACFMDTYSVGILRVCENFSGALSLFVAPFVTTWPLMAVYYKERRLDDIKNMFKWSSVLITAMIMPALTTVTVCASELLSWFNLSTSENQSLALVLFVFCLGTVYDAIIGPAGALLKMTEYSRISFYNAIVLLVLTIVFSYLMIPMLGLIGAAGAIALSHFVINTLNAWQNYRLFGFMPYGKEQFWLILYAVPVFFVVMYMKRMLNFNSAYNVIICCIISYMLFCIFTTCFYSKIRKEIWHKVKEKL